jgi:hypothetical protein
MYYAYIYAQVHQQLTAMQSEGLEAEKKQPPFDFTPNVFIRQADICGKIMALFKRAFCQKKYQKGLKKSRDDIREFAIEKKINANVGFDIEISDPKFEMFNKKVQDFSEESKSGLTPKQATVYFCQSFMKLFISWIIIWWLLPVGWDENSLSLVHDK